MIVAVFPASLKMSFTQWLIVLQYIQVRKKIMEQTFETIQSLEATEEGKKFFKHSINEINPNFKLN